MCRIEIPNSAIHREIQSRLEVDDAAIVIEEPVQGAGQSWPVLCFAFSLGVAMGWLWRF